MESDQAPVGKENWFVMINAPANEKQDWQDLKKQCREAVISKLNRMLDADIENYIEVEDTLDPVKIEEQTSSFMGAYMAPAVTPGWLLFFVIQTLVQL